MHFDWDEKKNMANKKKHGVSFEETLPIFYDPLTKVAEDPEHSESEERFLAIGHLQDRRALIVAHCYREMGDVIRIISARRLTKQEQNQYEEGI